ncbi:hypothetical protein quinque_007942 [Culex quinquefasciatus]
MIASSCLQGHFKIWDVTNGELMAEIHRNNYFDMQRKEGQRSPTGPSAVQRQTLQHEHHQNAGNLPRTVPHELRLQAEKEASVQLHQSKQSQEPKSGKDPSLFDFAAQYVKLRQNHNEEKSQRPSSSTARKKSYQTSPIWCLDFLDNLIVIGCADGRLEFWDGTTGNLKGIYEPEHTPNNGVTNIKLTAAKVVAARLSSRIDFLRLETPASVHHASEEELRCILKFHQQGPQIPETCREVAGETVMTGSKDHTVKAFRHGHCGPISCRGPFEPPKPGAGCDLGRGQPQDARVRAGKILSTVKQVTSGRIVPRLGLTTHRKWNW